MNLIIKRTLGALLALQATHVLAGTGNLFNVTTSGTALGQAVSYNLCLTINGKNPLSCQTYNTSSATLTIKTTAPSHTYHYAGIKINTPGYVYTAHGLRRSIGKQEITAPGYTGIGTVSDTQAATGTVASTTAATHTGIYVETNNSLVTYSPDNGTTWGVMLSPQGWFWGNHTWATAVTADGTMYQATGVQGNGNSGNGAATLIYSVDGIHWSQVASFPTNNDWVQSVFAVGNTVYVGTGNGYVYSTTDQGATWSPNTPVSVDGSTVNAIVVDASGIYYAGTINGTVFYSNNSGQTWTALPNQPSTGVSISSLAIDTNGTLYVITANTTTQPQYNTSPLTTGTWQSMGAIPAGDYNTGITTIAATGTTVYVGTDSSYVLSTPDKGLNWTGNPLPSGDTSGITALFVNQATALSPLFVESYGAIPINNSASDCTASGAACTVTVKNLSSTTASNVQADSTQLPAGVTQTSTPCASVASEGTCSIIFAANGTSGFTPTTFNIIDGNANIISRSALVSSITNNGGTNYYYVYNVNGATASVVDGSNSSGGVIWGSNGDGTSVNVSYDLLPGIDETSTTGTSSPSYTAFQGMFSSGTTYSTANPFNSNPFTACNGATDGACNTGNIYTYYHALTTNYGVIPPSPYAATNGTPTSTSDYAAGLCYSRTDGAAAGTGQWHLPAACELNGGIYLNVTSNQFVSCSPTLTSIFSLHSLGALGVPLSSLLNAGFYWSSTEVSVGPQDDAWLQYFSTGGGGSQYLTDKVVQNVVRCSQALTI